LHDGWWVYKLLSHSSTFQSVHNILCGKNWNCLPIEQLQLRHENTWLSTLVWQKGIVLNGSEGKSVYHDENWSSKLLSFLSSMYSFAIQTQKTTEKAERFTDDFRLWRYLQVFYEVHGHHTLQPRVQRCTSMPFEHNTLTSRQFLRYAHLTPLHISNSCSFHFPHHPLTPPPFHILTFHILQPLLHVPMVYDHVLCCGAGQIWIASGPPAGTWEHWHHG